MTTKKKNHGKNGVLLELNAFEGKGLSRRLFLSKHLSIEVNFFYFLPVFVFI